MKLGRRDAVDLVNAHKASVRRAIDEVEQRHDAFARAAAVFADELKIAPARAGAVVSIILSAPGPPHRHRHRGRRSAAGAAGRGPRRPPTP